MPYFTLWMLDLFNTIWESNSFDPNRGRPFVFIAALSQSGPMVYDSNRVAMIAGTSVSALLVVCIIIVVALLCYRRSLKAKRAKREEPTVVFTTADSSVVICLSVYDFQ